MCVSYRAPSQLAVLIREGEARECPALCELGIYGIYIGYLGQQPIKNSYGGYLLRVKSECTDEGGVAAGFAVLSSPELV